MSSSSDSSFSSSLAAGAASVAAAAAGAAAAKAVGLARYSLICDRVSNGLLENKKKGFPSRAWFQSVNKCLPSPPAVKPGARGKKSTVENYNIMVVTAGKHSTHLGRLLELVVGGDRDGKDVLVGVDERVGDRGNGGDANSERDGGDGLDARRELVDEGLLLDVKDRGREDGTVVVNLNNSHTVGERRDVEHVKKGGLRRSDLGAGSNDLNVVDDLNGTTGNLGGDTEGLEERGLSGLHTGVAGGDVDVGGGNGTGTSGGSDLVRDNGLTDLLEVTVGEDEADVATDEGEDLLELGELAGKGAESTTDHGVLAHEDNTLATESLTDHVALLRGDVVDVDNEHRG